MIPTAPVNKFVVTIKKKFYDTVKFDSGITLHIDPSWQPQEYSMLTATVVSVPRSITKRPDYKDLTLAGIKPGDEILMRFDVVFSYKNQVDARTAEFKNLVCLKDGDNYMEYWLCDIGQVFAILRPGVTEMVNDYVMLKPLIEERPSLSSLLVMPESFLKFQRKDRATIRAIRPGNPLKLKVGDMVFVDPGVVQQYKIDTDEFYIVKFRHVIAVVDSFSERIGEIIPN